MTQAIRGAVFDLLTSQNDRHAQNLFINGDGSIALIDNEVGRATRRKREGGWGRAQGACESGVGVGAGKWAGAARRGEVEPVSPLAPPYSVVVMRRRCDMCA